MEPTEVDILAAMGFGDEQIQAVRGFLRAFGEGVAKMLQAFHLRLSPAAVEARINEVARGLEAFRLPPAPASPPVSLPFDPTKTLARLAGAAFLAGEFRDQVPPGAFGRAFTLKILYEHLQDCLDHVIDHGDYSREDALRLYRLCVLAITDPHPDFRDLEAHLRAVLDPRQASAARPLAWLTRAVQARFASSPHADVLRPYVRGVNEAFAVVQTATMHLRRSRLDVAAVARVASDVASPDPDLTWEERYLANLSWVRSVSLLDLCYAWELPSPERLRDRMRAWSYFDAVICGCDHLADLWTDLRDGTVNAAMLAMTPPRSSLAHRFPTSEDELAPQAIRRFIARLAEFEGRALRIVRASGEDAVDFYPVLALLIPVVMLSRSEPERRGNLPAFVRELAPALDEAVEASYHSATYSQQGSPRRTQRGLDTRPWKPREARMPS